MSRTLEPSKTFIMHLQLLLILVTAAYKANALLRFACSQLVVERFDPLVTPGMVSPHLHQIVGGDAFDIGMHADNDLPTMSTCTTCTYSEDFSNYWTAVLYFKHQNGTFQRVPQRPGELLGAANGGMTLYYMQPTNGGKVTSFKKGFRMIIGDPMLRTFNSSSGDANNLNFRCLSAGGGNGGTSGAPGTDTRNLPANACAGGIRSEIVFPS
ncbi:hypothetical protein FA13DRAFT_1292984 [Coprinellus micaceus]|uniref:DUF1996 domain-containing protein n=1 Tax=Coprinellus micaceus TaxID=71717 RepID=A0A4Y7SS35_COPMI|nr:hypothetical protein FA13DRAFT_1292984 [Coprinellus micaceus]